MINVDYDCMDHFMISMIFNIFILVVNHVYLPDEDFDGIDWKKLHQPVHGPLGYDAASKEDIQLLSDPFFAPGVGEPIGIKIH